MKRLSAASHMRRLPGADSGTITWRPARARDEAAVAACRPANDDDIAIE
jgi:hypothetical protein